VGSRDRLRSALARVVAVTVVVMATVAGVVGVAAAAIPSSAPALRVEEAGDSLALQTHSVQLGDLTAAGFEASVDGENSQTIQSAWIQGHVDESVQDHDNITVEQSASNDALYDWNSQLAIGWTAADAAYRSELDLTLSKLVDQCVVLVDTRIDPDTEYYHLPEAGPHINSIIDQEAADHANVVVVPWSTISAGHDNWFWTDGLHFVDPTTGAQANNVGAANFAAAITTGVRQCADKIAANPLPPPPASRFTPLATPVRIVDTRNGTGLPAGRLVAGQTMTLPVAGLDGVPADAQSVDLNVTAVDESGPGFLSVFPTATLNDSSTLDYAAGQVMAAHVLARLSSSGSIDISTLAATDVVVDLDGWYAPSGADGVIPVNPTRILDTRSGLGAPGGAVGPGGTLELHVAGVGGVPTTGADAVVVNLTATDTSQLTVIRAWPSGQPEPLVSNLNPGAGASRANLVTVRVGADGGILLNNLFGSVDLVADVQGWYGPGVGSTVQGVVPERALDTRLQGVPLGQHQSLTLPLAGVAPVPRNATAVIITITAVDPTTPGWVAVHPSEATANLVSDVNFGTGDIVANQVLVPVGPDGSILITNGIGSADVVVDVTGYVDS
jgi:hypothetical protein